MLNNKKIRTMTKLAMFEETKGKEDIYLSKYYKNDYIRYNLLKSILSVTAGYVLILMLLALYNMEYLIAQAVTLNYKLIGTRILGVYLILLVIYSLCSIIIYSIKYDSSRKKLSEYYKNLKGLRQIYKEEEESR